MKKKVIERLLIFFVGIPVMVSSVLLLKECRHLLFHVIITVFSLLGTLELTIMLKKRGMGISTFAAILCGCVPTITASICIIANLNFDIVYYSIFSLFFITLVAEIFFYSQKTSEQLFEFSVNRIAGTALLLFYPSFLMTFIVRMTCMQHSTGIIILFMLLVFGCDSFAWLTGVSLGEKTRGYVKASPKKSLIGFVGGIIASLCIGILFYFSFSYFRSEPLYKILIISFTCSITSIIGDLGESVIKRSCATKDSGGIIPGRGGIFDSIDSIIITAPVFYVLIKTLYGF